MITPLLTVRKYKETPAALSFVVRMEVQMQNFNISLITVLKTKF